MDFNKDGHIDVIGGSFDGSPYISYGSKKGFKNPTVILDSQGRRIVLSTYYDWKEKKYSKQDRSPKGVKNPDDHMVSAIAYDWDADGDMDLILGDKSNARVYRQMNVGTATKPKFTGVNLIIKTKKTNELRMGLITAPHLADWDGDGLDDLICGGGKGRNIIWYRNSGKKGAPEFDEAQTLIKKGGPWMNGTKIYIIVCDLNKDGVQDLLVGNEAGGKMGAESPSSGIWYFAQKKPSAITP